MVDINFESLRFADMNNNNINYKPIHNIWFLAMNLSYILNVVVDQQNNKENDKGDLKSTSWNPLGEKINRLHIPLS